MPTIIALIGIDGAGKTTQARLLAEWLASQAVLASYYRNAGGRLWCDRLATRFGRRDAESVIGRDAMLVLETLVRWVALLRSLARAWFTRRVAVMDRYTYCQYASVRARGGRTERLARLLYRVLPTPALVCYLAVPPGGAHTRVEARGEDHETLDHLAAVDAAYRGLPEASTFHTVNAHGTVTEVAQRLRALVAASALAPTGPAEARFSAPPGGG